MMAFARGTWHVAVVTTALGLSAAFSAAALADSDADKAKLAKCAKDICAIIISKKAYGPDINCDLTKTWEKDQIERGAGQKNLLWSFGSAKCTVKVSAKRADLVAAVTEPENTFKFERQSVDCEIGDNKYHVSASVAPEIKFRNGSTTAVALHMTDIQGATLIKGFVWTAATLEENFGILQGDMIREVNKFIKKECPKILSDSK